MALAVEDLAIEGVKLVTAPVHADARGSFDELYRSSAYAELGIPQPFVQDNHSRSSRHVLRGMHFQISPAAQGKLVTVLHGAVLDVAVDLRPGSPTFMSWVSAELSGGSGRSLYVPVGCAHGFLALTDEVHFAYKCTAEYSPKHERGFRWNDPAVGIDWGVENPNVSQRDAQLPLAAELNLGELAHG